MERQLTQQVIIDNNGENYLVTYITEGRNGQWHRGIGDQFNSLSETIIHVNRHTRNMERMGYRVEVTDNTSE